MDKYCLLLIVLSSIVSTTVAYSVGAPPLAAICDEMFPGHGADAQTSPIPYTVKTDRVNVKPNDHVRITVSGEEHNKTFKGLLLVARHNNKIAGTFDIHPDNSAVKTIDCPNDDNIKHNAVTQTGNHEKHSVTFDYVVPNVKGEITIYVTIVESLLIYWVKQPVATLTVN